MSKINLPQVTTLNYKSELNRQLTFILRNLQAQIDLLSTGALNGTINAQTSEPTTGTYSQGDFVRNSTPTELGSASSKYVIIGWVCTASPLTFQECRVLTGN